jgi:putative colanic acid biosynthesis UDP-glucose lipid carrier transferase
MQDTGEIAMKAVFPALDGFALAVPEAEDGLLAKRVFDLAAAGLLLVLLCPLLALIALAVTLDSRGPILFRQRRTGAHGEAFGIYKFRSMHVLEDGAAVVQARQGDARVTRVGRILRVLSLDELPQLFNVIEGDMSLVGPRPHAVAHDEYYGARIRHYTRRQEMKPGITGWAQVNGARGATPELSDMEARIALDLWYVENQSLWLDLLILARTPLAVAGARNAV